MNRHDLTEQLGKDPNATRKLYEAIIGGDDRLPRRFLALGEAVAQSVGRIVVRFAGNTGRYGTGALVGSRLVITNNHVLDSPESAAHAEIQFGFYDVEDSLPEAYQAFRLCPEDFFYTSEELDFTLVAISLHNGSAFSSDYGYIRLLPTTGKALVGERVNIIQHAGGQPQTISIRANVVVDTFDQWIHYTSDTAPGSSGAPVFNDAWQLVGLHHAAVPRESSTGDRVVLNEGVRTSAIVRNLTEEFTRPGRRRGKMESAICGMLASRPTRRDSSYHAPVTQQPDSPEHRQR